MKTPVEILERIEELGKVMDECGDESCRTIYRVAINELRWVLRREEVIK